MKAGASMEPADPIWTLELIADRLLAPMAPMFVALRDRWTAQIQPPGALKSLLLMIVFRVSDGERFCREVVSAPAFRRFLNLRDTQEIDAVDLSRAIARLIGNENARQFVRDALARARSAGLLGAETLPLDRSLVDAWTSERPPAPPAAASRIQA